MRIEWAMFPDQTLNVAENVELHEFIIIYGRVVRRVDRNKANKNKRNQISPQ